MTAQTLVRELRCWSVALKTIRRNITGRKLEGEVYVLDRFITPGAVCFDIGAAYGRYAVTMSRLAGVAGRVYCFEPGEDSYKILGMIARFYGLKNIALVKKALSQTDGMSRLVVPAKGKGKKGLSLAYLETETTQTENTETVALTSIDQFSAEQGVSKVDFVKCDVEGAEMRVLLGARNIFDRDRPAALFEIDDGFLKRYGATAEAVYDFFYERGYQSFIYKDWQFSRARYMKEIHNYFFIPPGHRALETLGVLP